MNKLIILVGISGSGKSTFATSYIKENPNTLRINRDDIRKTLVGDLREYYQKSNLQQFEKIINNIEHEFFNNAIYNKFNLIIDNTNLKVDYIERWLNMITFKKCNNRIIYNINFKLFDKELQYCKEDAYIRDYGEDNILCSYDKRFEVQYIDKQYQQYQEIKKWLETNYKNQII